MLHVIYLFNIEHFDNVVENNNTEDQLWQLVEDDEKNYH